VIYGGYMQPLKTFSVAHNDLIRLVKIYH